MKTTWMRAALAAAAMAAGTVQAADKTYQVTGPVVDSSDTAITVMKGKEKWTLARTPDTKVTGDVKPGEKVTVEYTMTAKTIEAKAAKAAKSGKATKTDDAGGMKKAAGAK